MKVPVNVEHKFDRQCEDPFYEHGVLIAEDPILFADSLVWIESRDQVFANKAPFLMTSFIEKRFLRKTRYIAIVHSSTSNILKSKEFFDLVPEVDFYSIPAYKHTRLYNDYLVIEEEG